MNRKIINIINISKNTFSKPLLLKNSCFLILALCFFVSTNTYAQDDLVFDHITVTEGLTQGLVNNIYRDSRDFMWFGTLQGINRYDGINIKKFESLADDSTTITSGIITSIYEDKSKTLWVGTENGLNRYDYKKEKFTRFCHDPRKPNSLADDAIIDISEDSRGRLWVVTANGFNLYRPGYGDFKHLRLPVWANEKDADIEASYAPGPDTIYFFRSHNIFQLSTADLTIKEIGPEIKTKEANTLLVDYHHNIWIGTENDGAYRVTPSGKTTHFYPEKNNNSCLQSISVKSINQDSRKNIWLSTRDGLYRLNNDNKTFTTYKNETGNPKSLLSSYSRTFYEDRQGIIWVGTVGGVNKFNPGRLQFRHLKTSVASDIKVTGTLYSNDNIIWSFYLDDNNLLWVGSMRTLLSSIPFDKTEKGIFSTAVFRRNGKKIIPPFNSVLEIKGDKKNNLWLGTDNGLYYYDTHNTELKGYLHHDDNANSLSDNIITSIINCSDSVLWIGTTNGLDRFVPSKDRFTNYFYNPADSTSVINNLINFLYLENNKKLWIAALNGISCIDLTDAGSDNGKEIKFRNMRPNLVDKGKSFNEVLTVIKSHDKFYWLGTDNGIFMMDSSMKTKEHFSVQEGLPNKIINQIREDSRGHLWISTDNGLSCFDPEKKVFRNFTADDGLQSSEFNSNSSLMDRNGCFYFGGINGFNMFYPDSIKISGYSPKIVISGLALFNNPVNVDIPVNGFTMTQSIYETNEINLDYNQNFFTFEFSALDYTNPEKIQYEYKLEGLDENWVVCHNRHFANYTNVRPGKYVFSVRATNSDGVWSKNTAQIKVIVTPPFWKTKLFFVSSFLLLMLLIYAFYRYRVKTLERDKRVLEAEVQRRTQEISVINQDLKRSNSFIESVINNATYGIMVVNQSGDIIMANPAVSLLTGYSNSELLSMNFKELTPPRWQKVDMSILETLNREESTYIEKEYIRKDGLIIQVSVSISHIKDYDMPAFVNIITDITKRIANEKELQEHRTNLEALVKERTADLVSAKERAEKADRLKTAFLSNISHEIRTPMNAIIGFSNLLRTQSWEAEQVSEFINYITDGAHNLLGIVTNIVEISKISANDITLSYKKFNFIKLINDICSGFIGKAKIKGLDFAVEAGSDISELYIISDESKLSMVINHLLDNALKFTIEGSIRLGFSVFENSIEVYIQDSGIGISPDMQDDIFEPFKQAETSLSRAYGGSGLGLTIARAYIEKLGGRLWVDSKKGHGSKFFFSFPLIKSEEQ